MREPRNDAPDWDGGWAANAAAKRRDWARLTPEQLLEWLDDALDLALASGALAEDRRRRAAVAAMWNNTPAESTHQQPRDAAESQDPGR